MTSYVNGATVAHVMEWANGEWRSTCRIDIRCKPADYMYLPGEDNGWPLKHCWRGDNLPTLPWCRWCVTAAKRAANELIESVINPASERAA